MADDAAGSAPSGPSLSDQLSKAIAAPLPGSGGGPSKPPVNSARVREAIGLDKIDAKLAEDDENLDTMKAGMSFPKLTQPPPQQPQSDPFQAFGQPAMYLAIFGSLLTRNPLASAVNAGASVLKSTQAQDSAIGQQQYETWKINSENAVKLAQYEMNAYKTLMADKNSTIREKEAAWKVAAAIYKNPNLQTILESEGVHGAEGYARAYQKHVGDLADTVTAAHDHLTAHIDGGGSGSGGAGGGAAGGTHAAAGALNADGRRQLVAQALDADDPKVNAQGVDLLARQLEGTLTGKVPASERAKMELTLTKLAKISADLRSGDPKKVEAARQEAAGIPEIGPGLLRTAKGAPIDYSPPQSIEVDDPAAPNGKRQLLAQQNKKTGEWVSADESRTHVDPSGMRKVGAAETVPPLDHDAVAYWAAQMRLTGKMPPLGLGNPVYRKQILDEVAKQSADSGGSAEGDIGMQADVHANQQALNVLGRTRANVSNFEKTAEKEGDLALSLATKGGAQGGIPVMNRWIQSGRQEIAGDPDVAAFHAAVTSFKNEYARIMSAPGATGGVTSDSARNEADSLINQAMTQDQLQHVMLTMKQGMDNRIKSINEEYDTTKGRIQNLGKGADAKPMPAAKDQLQVGAVYNTPRGLAKWDGTHFNPVAQ